MEITDIGLTKNEAKAYETLLKLGKTTAAHISKESHVPYGRIYTVLASLEEKGLVKSIPEKTRKYFPSDPKELEEYIHRRRNALDAAEKRIKHFKSLYDSHEDEKLLIVKGERNFKRAAQSLKKSQRYNYNIKCAFRTDPEFMRELKARKRRGVKMLTLGQYDEDTKKNFEKWKKLQKTVKPIPNDGVAMSIHDGEEMLMVLPEANTIMVIKDRKFIKVMETLFLNYYNTN